jgi:trehalose 6-phosphate phosphatase
VAEAVRIELVLGALAVRAGLGTLGGRKVLELRPRFELYTGAGLRSALRLIPAKAAFYAGDDRTDIDAFTALTALTEAGKLERAVRVAVVSGESPAALAAAADLSVDGPDGFVAVLEALA